MPCRLQCQGKQQRERAVLMGSGLGLSLGMVGIPVGQAILDATGQQAMALMYALNCVAGAGRVFYMGCVFYMGHLL